MALKEIKVGDIFEHPVYGSFKVISHQGCNNVRIVFLNTGSEKTTSNGQIRSLKIKDNYHKRFCHIGYIGDDLFKKDKTHSKAKSIWRHMLQRCYDNSHELYSAYGGRGVSVCDEWHNFSNFYPWFKVNKIKGFELDKDILDQGNKLYCPDKCVFVPGYINSLVIGVGRDDNKKDLGVYFDSENKKYRAMCNSSLFGRKCLGRFECKDEAVNAYKTYKKQIIIATAEVALQRLDITPLIFDKLINWKV